MISIDESQMKALSDIVKPRREKVSPAKFADLPFIGMEHIEAHTMRLLGTVPAGTMRSSVNRFYSGDVLYGRLRPYLNKVYRPNFDGLCSAEFIVLPKTDGVVPDYLKYRLNSHDFVSFASHLNAGDRPRVDFDELSSFEIFFPSYLAQQLIVAEIEKQFSRLDDAVANLKRVKANLKRYKAAVLKAAVEGRLVETEDELSRREGRIYETGAQLLQRILDARRSQWSGKGKYKEPMTPDTADMPKLPDGWVWATAEQLVEFITKGTTPAAAKLFEGVGEIQFLKVYNLTFDGSLNYTYKSAFISRKTHEGELARSKVRAGDVLINIVGPPLGQVSVVPPVLHEANINQAIARFRPVPPLGSKFLSLTLLADEIMRWAISRAKTTVGQANLTLELCRALPIPLPPLNEQARIVTEVERRFSLVRGVEVQVDANLRRAESLRQAVLAQAFKGSLFLNR